MPLSNTRERLNENGGRILVEFDDEMLPAIHSTSWNWSMNNYSYPISYNWKWLDTKTLYIKISDKLDQNVDFYRFKFHDLRYLSGKAYGKDLVFEF